MEAMSSITTLPTHQNQSFLSEAASVAMLFQQMRISDNDETNTSMQTIMGAWQQTIQSLHQEIDFLSQRVINLDANNRQFQQQIQEGHHLRQQENQVFNAREQEYGNTVARINRVTVDLRQDNEDLINTLTQERVHSRQQISSLESQQREAREQIERLNRQLASIGQQLQEKTSSEESLQQQLIAKTTSESVLNQQLQEKNRSITELSGLLQSKIESETYLHNQLQAKIVSETSLNDQLLAQKQATDSKIQSQAQEINLANQSIGVYKRELEREVNLLRQLMSALNMHYGET